MALQSFISSSSSSLSYGFTYDVFLSFRGSDTRYGFTGNLYKDLCKKGIRTFIDDRELPGGDKITPSLFKAIEESRIFIPVLSINYASSSFCLDELVHIIHCCKKNGRLVLPIFYDVEPSNVRHQIGSYGKALAEHIEKFQNSTDNMERLQKWKSALTQTANFSGHHFSSRNGYEYEFIEKIVKYLSSKINRVPLYVADYPVGLESRVLKVNKFLDVGSTGVVHMLGIYGTGGMGKTTLARAVYNSIADQFDCLCFLHDVRENSTKYGLEHLQEKLLSKLVELDIELGDINEGIPIIKKRLHRNKVLLILDDVHELKQLQVLAGGLDWFGPGSRVIVTTRDRHLLKSHGIERAYELPKLNETEALELLRWNSFKNNKVDSNFDGVLRCAVTYASGLPLALEVVGSNLFGNNIGEWKSALDRYRRIPIKKIQEILKVSFDALEKDEQNVFLDIACCFKGYNLKELEDILYAHYGNCMKYQISVLDEKSLIKINRYEGNYVVTLHFLIEKMGKEIVNEKSPNEPGRHSRLWFHKDIIDVLEENQGSSEIEIIYLEFPSSEEEVVDWEGDELKKMENLKTLIVKNGTFSNGPKYLPNSLRVLEWPKYPSPVIPSDFCPKKLSICKLQQSDFISFGFHGTMKRFGNVRELNLDDCQYLTRIHDLRSFPAMKSASLRRLGLAYCTSLKTFPEILGEMKNITHISLMKTSIDKLPVSFQNLTGLQIFFIEGNVVQRLPSSIFRMPNLSKITFYRCIFPKLDDKWSSMVSTSPTDIQLVKCNLLDDCKCLREIRGIPPNLKHLSAIRCKSLTSSCKNMLLNQELHEAGGTKFCFSGFARIPDWFDHQSMGHTISFWFRNKLPSMALCFSTKSAATMPTGKTNFYITIPTLFINGNKYDRLDMSGIMSTHHTYLYDINLRKLDQHPFMKDSILLENEWNHAEIICEHQEVEPITEIGIHFYKEQNNMDDIQFTNPYEKIKLNDDDGDDFFYDVDDVLDDDNNDVFYDVIDVLDDDDDKDVLGDEDDHHSQ
ncbi:putative TIR domain, winged helix-turn-helix DNA-binding domain-containing protein [Medicago truncatula]|uniref:Putative TIR domain, winged helix-turn-helix DNA-binding domain-containing protein n=1 Tax=Medicago truncatula TaxID=3880 RepID=A0A396HGM2_MEDTR|nr:putative TIR domain, winged helix-turn-helix DNA-binding domain-containing protein [Medicago truncatula]